MEQAATSPEEVWQPRVCRLCAHRFELLITCPEDIQITLCQFCTLLVEWFGQPEEAPSLVAPASLPGAVPPGETPGLLAAPLPEQPTSQPEHVTKVPKRVRLREQLAGLLDQWGELWRSSQEE